MIDIVERNKIFDKHYRANKNNMLKKVYRTAGSVQNAEDIVNESYARALEYYSDAVEDFDKWFNTIVFNVLRDHKKQAHRP
jgi:DNA-directed RNA polymerase specialized sigma24 family protein